MPPVTASSGLISILEHADHALEPGRLGVMPAPQVPDLPRPGGITAGKSIELGLASVARFEVVLDRLPLPLAERAVEQASQNGAVGARVRSRLKLFAGVNGLDDGLARRARLEMVLDRLLRVCGDVALEMTLQDRLIGTRDRSGRAVLVVGQGFQIASGTTRRTRGGDRSPSARLREACHRSGVSGPSSEGHGVFCHMRKKLPDRPLVDSLVP